MWCGERYSSSVQTLIVVGVIAVVLLLVFAVVQFASRSPHDSRWDATDSRQPTWDDADRRVAERPVRS